jgi:dihydroorotase
MKLQIRSAKVIDPYSPHNGKVCDLLLDDGVVRSVNLSGKKSGETPKGAKVYEAAGQFISPGWFDMRVNFSDPGFEHKEDILSGCEAAAQGGFTGVATLPSTNPPVQSKGQVEYILNKSRNNIVSVYPLGAITQNREGKEITEMYDMHRSGAVAFSDGNHAIQHSGVMQRALQYTRGFDGLIISHAEDCTMTSKGQMNEGVMSTQLGLRGIPAIAEEMGIIRDLALARYTGSPLHISHISTAASVNLLRRAKKDGIRVTADVAAVHLVLNEEELSTFDTNYKTNPPLRTKQDVLALQKGLADGTIDAIVSDHTPEDIESKNVEFDYAKTGMIGLQTSYALLSTHLPEKLSPGMLVLAMAINPRKILNLPVPTVKEGEEANFTLFDTSSKWTFTGAGNKSRSRNSPFFDKEFKGRAHAIYNNKQFKILV